MKLGVLALGLMALGLTAAGVAHAGQGDAAAIETFVKTMRPGVYQAKGPEGRCTVRIQASRDRDDHPVVTVSMKWVDATGHKEKAALKFAVTDDSENINVTADRLLEGEVIRISEEELLEQVGDTQIVRFRQVLVNEGSKPGLVDMMLSQEVLDYENDPTEEMFLSCDGLKKVR